jgi:uncharacterized protein YbbC (DUF1343 family)
MPVKKTIIFGKWLLGLIILFTGCSKPVAVQTGLDVLATDGFAPFQEKTVGIVTNHTAVSKSGAHLVDLLHKEPNIEVKTIFAPEHGFRGEAAAGSHIEDNLDPETGIPIISIYGKIRKPSQEMLAGMDALIFDIQDVGARFYTYISTMGLAMEAAAEAGIPFYVLDRPNPLSGHTDGPVLDMDYRSFVGMYPIPIQHGMTVGELAQMILGEKWFNNTELDLALEIIPMKGWKRQLYWHQTDLEWIPPSPNLATIESAYNYPGLCLLEAYNVNEGRGTDNAFICFGAPYIQPEELINKLTPQFGSVLKMEAISYIPKDIPGKSWNPIYKDETVNGLAIKPLKPDCFRPVPFGIHLLVAVKELYPHHFAWRNDTWINRLWGSRSLYDDIAANQPAELIIQNYQAELNDFIKQREKYLIYP